jgi:hypothetical protein
MKRRLLPIFGLLTALLVSVPTMVGAAGPEWSNQGQSISSVQSLALDATEAEGLQFMREEEKLARDVYLKLGDIWGLTTFSNIARSEQRHTDSVATLLSRYGVADPASDKAGVFTNQTLQKLYGDLVAKGSASVEEALKVGAAIEEIDIRDLEDRLAKTDNADIQRVYGNLERGSDNHLRAFVSTLKSQNGEVYVPQYLSAEIYAGIVSNGGRYRSK